MIQNKPQRFNIRIAKNLIISQEAKILIISVTPQSLNDLLETIKSEVTKDHVLISIVSGISKTLTLSHPFLGAEIADIKRRVGNSEAAVIRAMPNTAIAFRESMTCIAAENRNAKGLDLTARIFDALGTKKRQQILICLGATMIVDEPQIVPATALCACGVAVSQTTI